MSNTLSNLNHAPYLKPTKENLNDCSYRKAEVLLVHVVISKVTTVFQSITYWIRDGLYYKITMLISFVQHVKLAAGTAIVGEVPSSASIILSADKPIRCTELLGCELLRLLCGRDENMFIVVQVHQESKNNNRQEAESVQWKRFNCLHLTL